LHRLLWFCHLLLLTPATALARKFRPKSEEIGRHRSAKIPLVGIPPFDDTGRVPDLSPA
jgi:hypothetical protein